MSRTLDAAATDAPIEQFDLPDASAESRAAILEERERRRVEDERLRRRGRRLRIRTILEATALFAIFECLLTYFETERAIASVFVGAALGIAWDRLGAGRFLCLATGLATHLAFRAHYGFGDAFTALFGALAFACLATGLGTGQETRRRDGGYLR